MGRKPGGFVSLFCHWIKRKKTKQENLSQPWHTVEKDLVNRNKVWSEEPKIYTTGIGTPWNHHYNWSPLNYETYKLKILVLIITTSKSSHLIGQAYPGIGDLSLPYGLELAADWSTADYRWLKYFSVTKGHNSSISLVGLDKYDKYDKYVHGRICGTGRMERRRCFYHQMYVWLIDHLCYPT